MNKVQYIFYTVVGLIGGTVSQLLGGFDNLIQTLIMFMTIDILMGVMFSLILKRSGKSVTGAYNSSIFIQGIFKKFGVLVCIIVAVRINMLLGVTYIRDGACIIFIVNEGLSILEQVGNTGVKVPKLLTDSLDVLRQKADSTGGTKE